MRSAPSVADRALIAALAEQDVSVSHAQLERWRQRGLLSRPLITRNPRRGTTVEPHDAEDAGAAKLLREVLGRGSSWQLGGVALFEYGFRMTESALRESAVWTISGLQRSVSNLWQEAAGRITPSSLDSEEALGDIAAAAAELSRHNRATRNFHGNVRRDLTRLKIYDRTSLAHATNVALGLRLADMTGADLSPDLRHIAKYGDVNAPTPDFPYSLHSEQVSVARTLGLREAYAMRGQIVAWANLDRYPEHLLEVDLLFLVVLELSNLRASEPPFHDSGVPLAVDRIAELESSARALAAQEPAEPTGLPEAPST